MQDQNFNKVKKRLLSNLDGLVVLYAERLKKTSTLREYMNRLEKRVAKLEEKIKS